MKLVNILARDWTTWPYEHAAFVSQDADRDTAAFTIGDQRVNGNGHWNGDSYISGSLITLKELADDHLVAIVTYGEWEIARESATDGWNGEGLPPVGTECDMLWSSTTGDYVQVKVVAHDEDRAVVRFVTGSRKGEYESDTQNTQYGVSLPIFRPIRTPKQIAAEERKHAIATLIQLFCADGAFDADDPEVGAAVTKIYDAGYRKTDVQ